MCQSMPKTTLTGLKPLRLILYLALICYACGFLAFRVAEILGLCITYPIESTITVLATTALLCYSPMSYTFIAIVTMSSLVYLCDFYVPAALPSPDDLSSYNDMVVVITGANSGIGFETSQALVLQGFATVIMACRSMTKCNGAANIINSAATDSSRGKKAIPMHLDLADFQSVLEFSKNIKQELGKDDKVDVLVNNAGYVPHQVESLNQYGLDPSFTSMHISHHLLAELLLEQNPTLRVVATSSGTHHICAFPEFVPSFLKVFSHPPGCVDEDFLAKGIHSTTSGVKYINAKVANIMHVSEIPRRHPSSTAFAIDLGWVGTSIQPWMRGEISPTSLGWMRSGKIGIQPVLYAILQPLEVFEPRDWPKEGGLLISVLNTALEPFSLSWWTGTVNKQRMEDLGKKLWEKTSMILEENGFDAQQIIHV